MNNKTKIKPHHKYGRRIKSLEELYLASLARKSIFCEGGGPFTKPTPAAWVINLQGRTLRHLLKLGMYLYETKTQNRTLPTL